jgi:glycosidase
LSDRPKAEAHATREGNVIWLDGSASAPAINAQAPLTAWRWTSWANTQRDAERVVGEGQRATVAVPTTPGDYHYRLRVVDERGQSDEASVVASATDLATTIRAPSDGPSYLDGAIVYGIVPAMFDGVTPLRGTAEALDGLAALGANVLWLSPVFETEPGDFGYSVTDYEHVRTDYGTAEDLRALVASAHRHSMRVVLDFVPNHTSKKHPYFRQAETLQRRSHYFDFFERDEQGNATHYFDWAHMANLHYGNSEVRQWMTTIAAEWIRTFGIDGYRVDAAWGVARRQPDYWPQLIGELRRIDPDLMLIAEASARDPYYLSHGFDVAYDWTEELGQWAWKDVFSPADGVARRLADALLRTAAQAGRPDRVLRFLNNNDTGARFITRYGEDMLRTATVLLLTLPGVPCLYAFDEIGAEYEPYAGLRPVPASARPDLRAFHERLIRLRRTTPALQGSGFALLPVARGEVFAYVRRGARPDEIALVILNFSPLAAAVTLPLPPPFSELRRARLSDLITRRSFAIRAGTLELTLAGWDTLVLAPADKREPAAGQSPATRRAGKNP